MLDSLNTGKAERSPGTSDIEALLGVGKRRRFGLFRWRSVLWLAAAAAVMVGAYVFWSASGTGAAVTYVTEPVTRGNLTVMVTATGSAQPITQVNISSELSGTVRKVLVDYNSPVKTGQVLAELDMDKLKASVENGRAKLEAVEGQGYGGRSLDRRKRAVNTSAGRRWSQSRPRRSKTSIWPRRLTTERSRSTRARLRRSRSPRPICASTRSISPRPASARRSTASS